MPKYVPQLSDYKWTLEMPVRVTDCGGGHLNYSTPFVLYDLATVSLLRDLGVDINRYQRLVVHAQNQYISQVPGFPEPVIIGIGTRKLGRSSFELEYAVFQHGDDAKVVGRLAQVCVDTEVLKIVELPKEMREGLQKLALPELEVASKL